MAVFEVFDNVEANYKELGKWFSGIIVAVHPVAAATGQFVNYDVAYDDGDSEADVRAENLRAIKKTRRDRGQKKIAAALEDSSNPMPEESSEPTQAAGSGVRRGSTKMRV